MALICVGGTDQYWQSSSKMVEVKICGPLPSFDEIPSRCSFMCIGTTIEFEEEKKKKNMDKLG